MFNIRKPFWAAQVLVLLLSFSVLMIFGFVLSRGVTIYWDRNTETNLVGYRIYDGPESRYYTNAVEVPATQPYYPVPAYDTGRYFTITAFDSEGLEGPWSAELFVGPCGPPTRFVKVEIWPYKLTILDSNPGTSPTYEVWSSTDLQVWYSLGTISGDTLWLEPNEQQRFFRVVAH